MALDGIVKWLSSEYTVPFLSDKSIWDNINNQDGWSKRDKIEFFGIAIGLKYSGYFSIGVGVYNFYKVYKSVRMLQELGML